MYVGRRSFFLYESFYFQSKEGVYILPSLCNLFLLPSEMGGGAPRGGGGLGPVGVPGATTSIGVGAVGAVYMYVGMIKGQ